jgi:methanethiol S-methyltransferase
MARGFYLLFGAAAYLIFLGTFLYLIAFVGALPWAPRTIDAPVGLAGPAAFAIDLGLVALFGVQHSLMARAGFKAAWTRIVPTPIERSTYVLFASLALIAMFLFWQPLPGAVWQVESEAGRMVLWALFAAGWAIVLVSTLLISHFELFGLKQVWAHARGAGAEPPLFREPFFYRLVRHPIYTGFFIAFWAAPTMTVGHLLFAVAMSAYMLVAIQFEERDLVRLFGEQYTDYRRRVGMLAPRLLRRG